MNTTNKEIVSRFIREVWNENRFDIIDAFIHPGFTDHSLPPALPANKEGLITWITGTGRSFRHETIIEEMVSEENKVMIKIRMLLKHTGSWRNIEPTGADVYATGYRYFRLEDNKILEHWALIDGNAIEKQLSNATNGCRIQH